MQQILNVVLKSPPLPIVLSEAKDIKGVLDTGENINTIFSCVAGD